MWADAPCKCEFRRGRHNWQQHFEGVTARSTTYGRTPTGDNNQSLKLLACEARNYGNLSQSLYKALAAASNVLLQI